MDKGSREGAAMRVRAHVKGALSGKRGVVVEVEQIKGGSLMYNCRIISADTVATLWWLSAGEVSFEGV